MEFRLNVVPNVACRYDRVQHQVGRYVDYLPLPFIR